MQAPKTPRNEARRLDAVMNLDILDTLPEDVFDRITRIAAHVMDVPFACVTIVDKDRQWFKSRVGLPVEETARRVSFCGHAINSKGLFLVPNAQQDERFTDNPLVTGAPNIAFYAGVPVNSPDGYPVGTLCAIGQEPKEPSESQQQLLLDLAAMVEDELKLRQQATTDDLSGLMNRRLFMPLVKREIARARRNQTPLSLMMLDVDHFKQINDQFGHEAGDAVITTIGRKLPELIRRPGDAIARFGGDEFMAVLADTDEAQAADISHKVSVVLKSAIGRTLGTSKPRQPQPSVSIGVAVSRPNHPSRSAEDFFVTADSALYESKDQGRNRVTVRHLA